MADDFDDLSMDMFEEFDIDVEPDKKKGKVAQVAEAVASLIKDTAKGAAKGIGKEVSEQFRDVGEVYQEAIDTVDDFQRLKSDIAQELGPATNTMKQITLRMLPKAKAFIPEKYYKSVTEKLKSSINPPEISAAQREAQMKQETIRDALTSIFQHQVQAQQAEATQNAANLQVDRQVAHIRFKAQSEALASLDSKLFTITDFLTGTFTGYIKKSLELKYNHLFIARDTFNAVKGMAKIVEARLIDIVKNTGLPDFAKQSSMHRNGAGALKRGANQTSTEFFSSFRQNFMKNMKGAVMNPLQMFTQQMLPMLDLGSQMAGMAGPMTLGSILSTVGGIGGNIGGQYMTRKFLNNNSTLVDLINNFTKGLKGRAQSKIEDWADKHRGFGGGPLGFLANLIPKFNRDTTVRNTLMEDQFETVPFDAITRQTIVEIIPAHLENIAKYVTGMAMSIAPGGKYENITFDKTTRKIETAATAREHYTDYYSGGKAVREQRGKDIMDRFKYNALGRNGADSKSEVGKNLIKKYDQKEIDLKKFIHNSSWYHQSFKAQELINWYNTDEQTEYIQKVFDNVEEPRELCELLLGTVCDKKYTENGVPYFDPNTINGIALANIENLVIDHFSDTDYIRRNADSINPSGDARIYDGMLKGNVMTNAGAQKATIRATQRQTKAVYRDGRKLTGDELAASGISVEDSPEYGALKDFNTFKDMDEQVKKALQRYKDKGIPDNDPIIKDFLLSNDPIKKIAAIKFSESSGFLSNLGISVANNLGVLSGGVKKAGEWVSDLGKSQFEKFYDQQRKLTQSDLGKTVMAAVKKPHLKKIIRDKENSCILVCDIVDNEGNVRDQKKYTCKLSGIYPPEASYKVLEADINKTAAQNKIIIDGPISDIEVVGDWQHKNLQSASTGMSSEIRGTSGSYDGVVEDNVSHPFLDDTTWSTINENIPMKLQIIADAILDLGKTEKGFIDDGGQRFSKGGRIRSSRMRKINKAKMKAAKKAAHTAGDQVLIKANPDEYVLNQDQMKNLQKLTGTSSPDEAFQAVREGKYSSENRDKIIGLLKSSGSANAGNVTRNALTAPASSASEALSNLKKITTNAISETAHDVKVSIKAKVDSLLTTTVFDKLPDKFKTEKNRKIWEEAVKKGKSISATIDEFAKKTGLDKQGAEVLSALKTACSKIGDEKSRNELIADTLASLSNMKSTIVDKDKRTAALAQIKGNIDNKINSISEKALKAYEDTKKSIEEKGVFGSLKSQVKKGWEWFKKTKFYKFVSDHIPEETKKQIKESFAKAKGDFSQAFEKAQELAKEGSEKLSAKLKAKEEKKASDVASVAVPDSPKPLDTNPEVQKDISIAAPKLDTSNNIAIEASPLPTGAVITPDTRIATATTINGGAVTKNRVPVTDIQPTINNAPIQGAGGMPGKTVLGGPDSDLFEGDVDSNFHKDFRLFALKQFEYNERIIVSRAKGGRGDSFLGGLAKGAGSAIGGGLNYLGQAVSGFYKGAGSAIGGIAGGLGNIGAAMFNSGFLGDLAKGAGTAIGGIGKGIGTAAGGFYKGLGTAISGTAKGIGGAIGGMFGGPTRLGGIISDAVTKATRPKFIDVYVKGKMDLGKPALSAKEQEEGVFFLDGKPLENTTDLKAPVYKKDADGNKKLVITEQDLEAGLVDAEGRDINSKAGGKTKQGGAFSGKGFGALVSGIFAGGGMLARGLGSLYKGLFSGAGSLIKGTAKVASTALGRMFGIDTEGTQKFHSDMITRFDKIIALLEGSAYIKTSKEEVDKEKADLKEAEEKKAAEENKDRDAALQYQKDKDAAEAKAKKDAENAEKSQNAQEQMADITAKDKAKYGVTIDGGKVSKSAGDKASDSTPQASKEDNEGGIVDDALDAGKDYLKNKAIKFARNKIAARGLKLLRKTKWGRKFLRGKTGKWVMKGVNSLLKKPGAMKHLTTAASKGGGIFGKVGGFFGKIGGGLSKVIPGLSKAAPALSSAGSSAAKVAGKAAAPLALAAVAYGGVKGFTASEQEDKKYAEDLGKEGFFKRALKTAINPVRQGRIIASTVRNAFGAIGDWFGASQSAKKANEMLNKMDEKNLKKLQELGASAEDIEKYKTVLGKDDKDAYALRRQIMMKYRKPDVSETKKPEEKKEQKPENYADAIATIQKWKDKPSSPERTAALKKAGVDFPDDTDDVNQRLQELILKQKADQQKPKEDTSKTPASSETPKAEATKKAGDMASVATESKPVATPAKPNMLVSGNKALDNRVKIIKEWKDKPDSPERTRMLQAAGIVNVNNKEAIDGRLVELTKFQQKHITKSGGTVPSEWSDASNVLDQPKTTAPSTPSQKPAESAAQAATPTQAAEPAGGQPASPQPSGDKTVKSVTKRVSGQLIGYTLVPIQGESKEDYEKRLASMQALENRKGRAFRRRPTKLKSIYTKEGLDSYKAARTMSAQMQGGSYDPQNDEVLKNIESTPSQKSEEGTTPDKEVKATQGTPDVKGAKAKAAGTIPSFWDKVKGGVGSFFGIKKQSEKQDTSSIESKSKDTKGEKYPAWWGSDEQKSRFVQGVYVEKTNGHLAGDNFGEHLSKGYKLFEAHKAKGTLDVLFKQFGYTPDGTNDSEAPNYWRKEEEAKSKTLKGRAEKFFKNAGEKIGEFKDKISEKYSELKDRASAKYSEIKDKVANTYGNIKTGVTNTAKKVGAFASEKFDQAKEGIVSFGRNARNKISDTAKAGIRNAMLAGQQIGDWIRDPESFKSDMRAVGTSIKEWWNEPGVFSKMAKGAKRLGTQAKIGYYKLKGGMYDLADKGLGVLENMGKKYNDIRDRSIEGLKTGWDLAKTTGQNALNWTKDTYAKGKQMLGNAWDATKQYGQDIWTGGKAMAQDAWDFVKSGGIQNWMKDKFQNATGAVKQFGSNVWNKATGMASDAWNATKQFGKDVWTGSKALLSEGWNKTKDFFGGLWKKTKQKAQMGWEKAKSIPSELADKGLSALINMGEGYNKLRDRSIEGLKTGWDVVSLTGKNMLNSGKEWLNQSWDKAKRFAVKLGLKTQMEWEKFQRIPNDIKLKVIDGTMDAATALANYAGLDVDKNGRLSIKKDQPKTDKPKSTAAKASEATQQVLGGPSKEAVAKAEKVVDDLFNKQTKDGEGHMFGVAGGEGISAKTLNSIYKASGGDKAKFEQALKVYFKEVHKDDPSWDYKGSPNDDEVTAANRAYERKRNPDFHTNAAVRDVMEQYWPQLERRAKQPVQGTAKSTPVSAQIKDTKRSDAVTTAADKTTSEFAKHDDAKAEAVRKQQEAAKAADATKQQSDSSKEISTSIVNSGNAQLASLDRIAGLLERQIVATEGVGAKTKRQADEAGINAVKLSQQSTEAMVSPLRPKPQPKQPKPPAINVNKTVLANA